MKVFMNILLFFYLLLYSPFVFSSQNFGSQIQTDRREIQALLKEKEWSGPDFRKAKKISDMIGNHQIIHSEKVIEESCEHIFLARQRVEKSQDEVAFHEANYQQARNVSNSVGLDTVMALWYENSELLNSYDKVHCLKIHQAQQEINLLKRMPSCDQWEYFHRSTLDPQLLSPDQLIHHLETKLMLYKIDFENNIRQDQAERKSACIIPFLRHAKDNLIKENKFLHNLVVQQQVFIARNREYKYFYNRLVDRLHADSAVQNKEIYEKWNILSHKLLAIGLLSNRLQYPVIRWKMKQELKKNEQAEQLREAVLKSEVERAQKNLMRKSEKVKRREQAKQQRNAEAQERTTMEREDIDTRDSIDYQKKLLREKDLLEQSEFIKVKEQHEIKFLSEEVGQLSCVSLMGAEERAEKDLLHTIAKRKKGAKRNKLNNTIQADDIEHGIQDPGLIVQSDKVVRITFSQFLEQYKEKKEERDRLILTLQKDRTLSSEQRQFNLQEYDRSQIVFRIKNLLSYFLENLCCEGINLEQIDLIHTFLKKVIAFNKVQSVTGERLSWYVYGYKTLDQGFKDLCEKLHERWFELRNEFEI
jgi:hypothetical protein